MCCFTEHQLDLCVFTANWCLAPYLQCNQGRGCFPLGPTWDCGAVVTSASFAAYSAGVLPGNSLPEVQGTGGGQWLVFAMDMGNTTTVSALPFFSAQGGSFQCAVTTVAFSPVGSPHALVNCTLPPCTGQNLTLSNISSCVSGHCFQAVGAMPAFSVAGPVILNGTLGFYTGSPVMRQSQPVEIRAAGTGTQVLQFGGTGFWPDPALMSVTVGPPSNPTQLPCALDPRSTYTTVICAIAPGGTGVGLVFAVQLLDYPLAVGVDVLNYPPPNVRQSANPSFRSP